MTNEEAKKMLEAKLECLKRETSGTDIDCNYRNCDECSLCYEQGNMGEQEEALSVAIKALKSQPNTLERDNNVLERVGDCISREEVMKLLEKEDWADTVYGVQALPPVKPQPKTGPCEDCISREDALKAIEEQKQGFYGVERYAIDECHSAVMKLPSVGPYREIVEDKRACEKCIHYVTRDSRGVVLCGCDSWECDFEEVKT